MRFGAAQTQDLTIPQRIYVADAVKRASKAAFKSPMASGCLEKRSAPKIGPRLRAVMRRAQAWRFSSESGLPRMYRCSGCGRQRECLDGGDCAEYRPAEYESKPDRRFLWERHPQYLNRSSHRRNNQHLCAVKFNRGRRECESAERNNGAGRRAIQSERSVHALRRCGKRHSQRNSAPLWGRGLVSGRRAHAFIYAVRKAKWFGVDLFAQSSGSQRELDRGN